jgi:hypothetical protein
MPPPYLGPTILCTSRMSLASTSRNGKPVSASRGAPSCAVGSSQCVLFRSPHKRSAVRARSMPKRYLRHVMRGERVADNTSCF